MARKNDEKKAKVRVVVFEMEGSDDTLQDSLRTIASAFNRNISQIRPSSPQQSSPVLEQIQDEEHIEDNNYEEAPKRGSSGNRNRTYRKPQILHLDLDSDISLRDFCTPKNTSSNNKKYLTIMAWFHDHRDTRTVGPDHVYTGFKKMGWSIPKDASQPFRNLKHESLVDS